VVPVCRFGDHAGGCSTLLSKRMMAATSMGHPRDATPLGMGLPAESSAPLMASENEAAPRITATGDRVRSLVDAHYDFVWRSLRGLGVLASGIDDATQQVFVIAAQKIDAITVGSERPFLFSTARGIAANVRRARARSHELLDESAMMNHVDHAPGPEQLAVATQAKQILSGILDSMNEDVRSVFVLFELEGLPTADIAEILGVPTGTVASRLRRAREEFQAATKRFRAARGGGR